MGSIEIDARYRAHRLSARGGQVMGNQATITLAAAQSFLKLNACKPATIYNVLQSYQLLADTVEGFASIWAGSWSRTANTSPRT